MADSPSQPHTVSAFGECLRRHRVLAGLTQQALADRAGLSPRAISDLERGVKRSPHLDTVRRLVKALVLSASDARAFRYAARSDLLHRWPSEEDRAAVDSPRVATVTQHRGPAFARPTLLLGRAADVAWICARLRSADVRLLTLTGAGGVGKTRLALAALDMLGDELADTVACVDLSPVRDPALVIPVVARTLGIGEAAPGPLRDLLIESFQGRRVLLLLDNVEQVVQAATDIDALLEACPDLRVLATSREPLHVRREHLYVVPPLPLEAAIQLFVQRAAAVQPAFVVTDADADTIATICRRLDCLPLAIELAAARSTVLDPRGISERLGDRLALLRDGPRDAPDRQRGLAATLAWSHDLLTPSEQAVFRRLASFTGGFALPAAAAVAAPDHSEADVVHTLTGLVDRSLLKVSGDRFVLLETVREYAATRLAGDRVEHTQTHERHAHFFLRLAEAADAELHGNAQNAWLARLEAEHDNLRAALDWAVAAPEIALALRLVAALSWFWYVHTYLDEGCQWAERVLSSRPPAGPAGVRARALAGAALLHENRGEYAIADALLDDASLLANDAADQALVGWCSAVRGLVARNRGDYEVARQVLTEGVSIARRVGEPWMLEVGLLWLASVERYSGNLESAMRLFDESLALGRALGDRLISARVLAHLSGMFSDAGDAVRAQVLAEECRAIGRETGSRWTEGIGLVPLAIALTRQERFDAAVGVLREAFQLFRDIGDGARVAYALNALAHLAQAQHHYRQSALLLGAARAVRRRQGEAQTTGLVPAGSFDDARAALGAPAFDAAVEAGSALGPADIAALVLD